MAVVTESFSIREYTRRMRSIDLRRCWPFDDGREVRPLLPSISVRRFKWWGDELDSARSTAMVEEEDDQSKDAAVAAISEADDFLQRPRTAMEPSAAPTMGYEGRRTVNKGKQRTPKKRSIVELFAAAPLIAAVEANSDEGERWEEEDAIEEEEKEEIDAVMKKKAILKDNIIKKKKRKKKKKNKGIKDGLKEEICAWEKEKICKPKMTSSVQSYMFQNPVCSKKSRKMARSFVENQNQPAKEKAVGKKHKVLRTSMLLSRNQEVAKKLPVRSILKNQKRGTTDRKSSKSVSAKAANLIKFYCKSNRHVTFSVKDETERNNRACSSVNFPQLQNLCKIFSDVLAASSVMNHTSKGLDLPDANNRPPEVNPSEKGAHSNVVSRLEASSTEKNQSSDSIVNLCQPTVVNSSNSSCSGTEKASFAVMVDLNHAIDADDIDCGIPATSTLSTSCIYSGEKNQNSTSDVHLEAGLARSSEPSLVPVPIASSDVRSSMTVQKNPSSHSSTSCLIVYNNTNERQCQPHVDADANFYRQIEEHQSGDHRSPKDMLSNICYSMGSKKLGESLFTRNPVSASKSKCPGEDFIGLPLNSQGELIQLHSGTKFSEVYNKQNMEWGSSHVFSANRHVESNNGRMNHVEIMRKKAVGAAAASYQKNQSDWNQKQCYSTRERVRHWLNFAELEGSERLDFHKNEPMKAKDIFLHCNSNPRSHSFHEYRNGDVSHDFCDRVDLQEKYNVDYHSQPSLQPTMRLMGKNVLLSGITRDYNGFNDGRTWNNNREKNLADQTQFSQQWMQRESVSHPTIGRSKGNLLELLDSPPNFYNMKPLEPTFDYMNITQPPQWPSKSTDSAIVNHTFKFDMNNHALPPHTQFLGTPIPSHPQNFHHHMLLTSSLCKHNQKVSSITPLLQPTEKLPHWLVHAKHQKITQFSDSNHHLPPPYHVPLIPLSTASKPIKMKEKTPKIIKRPADFDDGTMNSAKKPLKGKSDSHVFEAEGTEKMNDRPLDFQKTANESRSGPTKLIAGAKHILKPCHRMDEENCRPIHSTIIAPTTDASGKLFRPENNISNIYNF